MITRTRATIKDLYDVPDNSKAEIVNGEIVLMSPTGGKPGRAGGKIYASLDRYEREYKTGYAFPDNVGFKANLPNRESFSPDAAFHKGIIVDEDFVESAPIFAAEVRSKFDYGENAEKNIRAKINDYFKAGTQVVWDVDILRDQVIKVYRASEPDSPTVYHRGDIAEAEPAVPGWQMPVDDLFT
jgi:Uma2 family endonuclease